jgi:hypothetical protein
MWLITGQGFLSVVEKTEDREAGTLTVRARVRADLEALLADVGMDFDAIEESGLADYRFRARVERAALAEYAKRTVERIDYSNFKGSIRERHRHDVYVGVWCELLKLQQRPPDTRRQRLGELFGDGDTDRRSMGRVRRRGRGR